ncbi:MAG: hypothetical protein DMF62_01335 [Acidobacteria bacterium]|nr:MAG: hypothetical protein DMF62_01335 [Acidobacteriota bacterium]
MLGFTLKRYSCYAFILLTIFFAHQTGRAQSTEKSAKRPEDIVLDQLIAAIDKDDRALLLEALATGFPADVVDSSGGTLLMQAARAGKINALRTLLQADADPNVVAANGVTALLLAINGEHVETVTSLLANGADPNLRGSGLPSALTYAAASDNSLIISALIKGGADLNAKDQRGYDPLEFAFLNKKSTALKVLRPIYRQRENTITNEAFFDAITSKNDAVLIRSLALGFDPVAAIGGKMPLEIAIAGGHSKGVALLVHAGANVNQMSKKGIPVWWAALQTKKNQSFDAATLKTLLRSGADTSVKAKGKTALEFAGSNKDAVAILKANGAR